MVFLGGREREVLVQIQEVGATLAESEEYKSLGY